MNRAIAILTLTVGLVAGPAFADHERKPILSKENIGGAIGATVGAFAGSKVADGKTRLVTTAAGAVGGFLLGEKVAHNYHGRGHSKSYGAGHGSHGYTHRSESRRYHEPRIHPIRETYVAKCNSNVRAGPSTRFAVTDMLYQHERVRVIGKVEGRNWYLVRNNGHKGFVHASLLEPEYRSYGYQGSKRRYQWN